jgi:hypothetical protein
MHYPDLMRLDLGDALSVQGTLKAEVYVKDGDTKLSLSIVADHVLALRHPQKPPATVSARRWWR